MYYYAMLALLVALPLAIIGIFLYQCLILNKVYYTNLALENFRETRHDLTMYLSERMGDDLTVSETEEYYRLLIVINSIIRHYDKIKFKLSNITFRPTTFTTIKPLYQNIAYSSAKLSHIQPSEHSHLEHYKIRVCDGVLTSIKAIPLFHAKFLFYLIKGLFSILISLGYAKAEKQLSAINRLTKIEKDLHQNGCFN